MKKRILVRGPAMSRSGYGEQSRFCLRALRAHEDKFDIFLVNVCGRNNWLQERGFIFVVRNHILSIKCANYKFVTLFLSI